MVQTADKAKSQRSFYIQKQITERIDLMTKRLLSLMLALVLFAGTCLTVIPSLTSFATFEEGDVITITDKAGGGVFPEGSPIILGDDAPTYYVSAMTATDASSTALYYAWCASYGVATPDFGREYVLYEPGKAGTVTVDGVEYDLCRYNAIAKRRLPCPAFLVYQHFIFCSG